MALARIESVFCLDPNPNPDPHPNQTLIAFHPNSSSGHSNGFSLFLSGKVIVQPSAAATHRGWRDVDRGANASPYLPPKQGQGHPVDMAGSNQTSTEHGDEAVSDSGN